MTFDQNQWRWWTETLEYVRTISGKIYGDQLFRLSKDKYQKYLEAEIPTTKENIVDYLNQNTPTGNKEYFLKVDAVTNGIYTIPSQRVKLDAILRTANEKYVYNYHLYIETPEDLEECPAITFTQLKGKPELFAEVFQMSEDRELTVDLTKLSCGFRSFDLDEIADYFLNSDKKPGNFHFGEIKASQMIFLGDTRLGFAPKRTDLPLLCKGAGFNESTFYGPLSVENLTFAFGNIPNSTKDDYDSNKIDFRNVRFFDSVSFRDARITGGAPDMEINFEDARIQKEIEFINVDFGHVNVCFFQTVVGEYISYVEKDPQIPEKPRMVQFKNIDIAEDSQIDFSDAEMTGTDIIFENIPNLPKVRFGFAPVRINQSGNLSPEYCPQNYLLIKNCEINQTLYIGNVAELSFLDSCNYSKVVEADNWGKPRSDRSYRTSSRGLGGTYISNPLLRAIYNNKHLSNSDNAENKLAYAKAKDFIMLKENFCSSGKYDEEDEAFILYMELKPYINSTLRRKKKNKRKKPYKDFQTNLLYKCLYAFGKYGISPVRIIFALLFMIFSFSMIYFVTACVLGDNAFSIGRTMENIWNCADQTTVVSIAKLSLPFKLLASFLYSLEGVIPFVSQFQPISVFVCIVTAVENALGSFLVGYFSVAVVRKTLR